MLHYMKLLWHFSVLQVFCYSSHNILQCMILKSPYLGPICKHLYDCFFFECKCRNKRLLLINFPIVYMIWRPTFRATHSSCCYVIIPIYATASLVAIYVTADSLGGSRFCTVLVRGVKHTYFQYLLYKGAFTCRLYHTAVRLNKPKTLLFLAY
jgi:hypothetical protein